MQEHIDTTFPAPDNSLYEFPPGYLERSAAAIQGGHAAGADPLPGPLLDAFLPAPLAAAGFELRPAVAADWAILKRIDSPILRELQSLAMDDALPRPEIVYEEEDVWELLYLWTRPAPAVRAELAKGRPQFRETALAATADLFPFEIVAQRGAILQSLAQNLFRALSTRITHAPAGDGPPGFPKAPPGTASAGGSTT